MPEETKEKLIDTTGLTDAATRAKQYTDKATATMITEAEAKTLIRESFNDDEIRFYSIITETGLEDIAVPSDWDEQMVISKICWYAPKRKFYAPDPSVGKYTVYKPYDFFRFTSRLFFCTSEQKFYRYDYKARDLVEAFPESTTSSQNTQIPLALFPSLPKILLSSGGALSMEILPKWSEYATPRKGMYSINAYYAMKNKDETKYRLMIIATDSNSSATSTYGVDIPIVIAGDKTEDGQYTLKEGMPFIEIDPQYVYVEALKDPYGVVSVIRNGEVEKITLQ